MLFIDLEYKEASAAEKINRTIKRLESRWDRVFSELENNPTSEELQSELDVIDSELDVLYWHVGK